MSTCPSILIVEDDADLGETIQDVLALEGYQARVAENGKVALDVLVDMGRQGQKPCLILLDLMMPVMDGWQFLNVIKTQCGEFDAGDIVPQTEIHSGSDGAVMAFGEIPVVIVSAVADINEVQQQYQCPVIKKPAEIAELLSAARQYCAAV